MDLQVKSLAEPASPRDGTRVLVEPPGVPEEARLEEEALWMPELAPSARLRRWYEQHRQWELFRSRYLVELLTGPGTPLLELARRVREGPLTLLSATPGPHSPAQVVAEVVAHLVEPPPKSLLRRRLRAWRATLPAETAAAWSRQIHRILTGRALWREARGVLLYLSVGREVATGPLVEAALREGKTLFAPKVDRRRRQLLLGRVADPAADLVPGPFQAIPEPRTAQPPEAVALEIDLVLVPGLAFDPFGHRVGYGAGYYDRLLARLPAGIPRVGLLYAGQLVPRCPAGPTDQPLDGLVCEHGWLHPWPAGRPG